MPDSARTHPRLSARMEERRRELGIRWGDVTARGGPSVETMRAIRRGDGRPVKELTLAAIARGLGLPPGEVEELAAADEATWPPLRAAGEMRPDPYEESVLSSDKVSAEEKATLIREHREHIAWEARKLAERGIDPPPAFLRGGVRHLAGGHGEPGEDRRNRPA